MNDLWSLLNYGDVTQPQPSPTPYQQQPLEGLQNELARLYYNVYMPFYIEAERRKWAQYLQEHGGHLPVETGPRG